MSGGLELSFVADVITDWELKVAWRSVLIPLDRDLSLRKFIGVLTKPPAGRSGGSANAPSASEAPVPQP